MRRRLRGIHSRPRKSNTRPAPGSVAERFGGPIAAFGVNLEDGKVLGVATIPAPEGSDDTRRHFAFVVQLGDLMGRLVVDRDEASDIRDNLAALLDVTSSQ